METRETKENVWTIFSKVRQILGRLRKISEQIDETNKLLEALLKIEREKQMKRKIK